MSRILNKLIIKIVSALDNEKILGKFVKMILMATVPGLDTEFMQYWLKLSMGQKESLLQVAKNFVGLQSDENDVTDLRKKLIQEERAKYLRGEGKSFSWEEVKNMAQHKDQRHGL